MTTTKKSEQLYEAALEHILAGANERRSLKW